MYLDYSRPAPAGACRVRVGCWARAIFSHRARVEAARGASWVEALAALGAVALLAAALTASHVHARELLAHAVASPAGMLASLRAELPAAAEALGLFTLAAAPLYFAGLALLVAGVARLWSARSGGVLPWGHCFGALAATAVPLLWFFLLVQLDILSPLLADRQAFRDPQVWNPVTNAVRFVVLMAGVALAGAWVAAGGRLMRVLREAATARG